MTGAMTQKVSILAAAMLVGCIFPATAHRLKKLSGAELEAAVSNHRIWVDPKAPGAISSSPAIRYYYANGRYEFSGENRARSPGTYSVIGDRLCTRLDAAPQGWCIQLF